MDFSNLTPEELQITAVETLGRLRTNLNTVTGIRIYLDTFNELLKAFSQLSLETTVLSEFETLANSKTQELQEITASINNYISKLSYTDLVRIAYFRKKDATLEAIAKDYKVLIQELLNPSGDKAFLNWDGTKVCQTALLENGDYKTAMTKEVALDFYKHFTARDLKRGQKFGDYVVMRVYDKDIRISCGLFANDMIDAIYSQIQEDEK